MKINRGYIAPQYLETLLRNAGFSHIENVPVRGHSSLALVLGFCTLRRPITLWCRKVLSCLFWPLYRMLLRFNKAPLSFNGDTLFPGLSGLAMKEMQK